MPGGPSRPDPKVQKKEKKCRAGRATELQAQLPKTPHRLETHVGGDDFFEPFLAIPPSSRQRRIHRPHGPRTGAACRRRWPPAPPRGRREERRGPTGAASARAARHPPRHRTAAAAVALDAEAGHRRHRRAWVSPVPPGHALPGPQRPPAQLDPH